MMTTPTTEMLEMFLTEAWDTVSTLERTSELLLDPVQSRKLVVAAHRLKGSAGMYQFPEIANLAGLLERVFESAPEFTSSQQDLCNQFAQTCGAIFAESLERITERGDEGEVGLELARLGGPELLSRLLKAGTSNFTRKSPEELATARDLALVPDFTRAQQMPVRKSMQQELREYFAQNPEVWEYFAPEVLEHLESVPAAIEHFDPSDPSETINTVFRAMHTIKGAAYSVGCQPLGKLAHRLEDILVKVRDGATAWSDPIAQAIVQGTDTLSMMLHTAEGRETKLEQSMRDTQGQLDELLGVESIIDATNDDFIESNLPPMLPVASEAPKEPAAPLATIRVGINRLESVMNISGEVLLTRARLDRMSNEFVELSTQLESSRMRLLQAATEFSARYGDSRLATSDPNTMGVSVQANTESIKPEQPSVEGDVSSDVQSAFSELEFDRYDDLSLMSRGISELTADLGEIGEQFQKLSLNFKRETTSFERTTRNLRLEAGRLRMVSMGRFYQRLRRQIRQTAGELGKSINLELTGENVEVDNLVLDGLADSLIHLMNNAAVHGIESREDRLKRGKPIAGSIRVSASRRGNYLVIDIQDDGNGMDVGVIKQTAVARGLRRAEDVIKLSNEEALELIFLPGLSTANTISDRAGRGVGMDIVYSSVRKLKGEVAIQTESGFGTRFSLRIPATMIISDVLMLETAGERYALPGEAVRALRSVLVSDLRFEASNPKQAKYDFQGERLDLLDLSELLGLPKSETVEKRISIVVLETTDGRIALKADRFLGLEQALVRALEEPFSAIKHVSGAMVGTDGEAVILLDPTGLERLERSTLINDVVPIDRSMPHVLLVDDSLSVRRVVSQIIRRLGYEVTTAADGQDAINVLANQDFMAVITDLEMPRVNGFELVSELRRRSNYATVPVAMLTTRTSDKHRDFAMRLGVSEYFNKPLDENQLRRFLEIARQHHETQTPRALVTVGASA
jgi:chemosensory pili system protein ChpA (sensor histidine kinase/response regulator)